MHLLIGSQDRPTAPIACLTSNNSNSAGRALHSLRLSSCSGLRPAGEIYCGCLLSCLFKNCASYWRTALEVVQLTGSPDFGKQSEREWRSFYKSRCSLLLATSRYGEALLLWLTAAADRTGRQTAWLDGSEPRPRSDGRSKASQPQQMSHYVGVADCSYLLVACMRSRLTFPACVRNAIARVPHRSSNEHALSVSLVTTQATGSQSCLLKDSCLHKVWAYTWGYWHHASSLKQTNQQTPHSLHLDCSLIYSLYIDCYSRLPCLCMPEQHAIMRRHASPYLTLLSVVYEAPALLDFLSPRSRALLSGCSRQPRACIHSVTSSITLTDAADLAAIANTEWPRLSLIAMRNAHCNHSLCQEVRSALQCLAGLQLQLGPPYRCTDQQIDSIAVLLVRQQLRQPRQHVQPSSNFPQLTTALPELASPPSSSPSQLQLATQTSTAQPPRHSSVT